MGESDTTWPEAQEPPTQEDNQAEGTSTTATESNRLEGSGKVPIWRQYVYLYSPFIATMALFLWFEIYLPSERDFFKTIGVTTIITYSICSAVHEKPPDEDESDGEPNPWEPKSVIYRLAGMVFFHLDHGYPLTTWRKISLDFLLANMVTSLRQKPSGASLVLKIRRSIAKHLNHVVILLWLVAPIKGGTVTNLFMRGYRNDLVPDIMLSSIRILSSPGSKKLTKAFVFMAQGLIIFQSLRAISTFTPFLPLDFLPCIPYEQDLIAVNSCYDSIPLNDPELFYRQEMCYSYGHVRLSARDAHTDLAKRADGIALRCAKGFQVYSIKGCHESFDKNGVAPSRNKDTATSLGFVPLMKMMRFCSVRVGDKFLPLLVDIAEQGRREGREGHWPKRPDPCKVRALARVMKEEGMDTKKEKSWKNQLFPASIRRRLAN